jgi:hypothetical protein
MRKLYAASPPLPVFGIAGELMMLGLNVAGVLTVPFPVPDVVVVAIVVVAPVVIDAPLDVVVDVVVVELPPELTDVVVDTTGFRLAGD